MTLIKTRFPPEPNGFLHIGHAKSIFINWAPGNQCHLRLDDTNPAAEKQEYVDNIIQDLTWLGLDLGEITYTSDYFAKLHEYAIELITNELAYVDFSSSDKIKEERKLGISNEFRFKPVQWNLSEFEKMTRGEYSESECVLRLKINMQDLNHTLRDPIAYRINKTPHYRTGTNWKIYPSYDYSHGIIDALEEITHSYCTDEFYIRRDQYYWPVNCLIKLGHPLKPAQVIEYGKLAIENNILSKRNINKLVADQSVSGYDDPRLLTIRGLRRRGFTPSVIKKIAGCSGFDRKETMLATELIDGFLRDDLADGLRAFAVIDPVRVHVDQLDKFTSTKSFHPNHPVLDKGAHSIQLTNEIYIEKEDYKTTPDKNYFRYTPDNIVRLRYSDFTKMTSWPDTNCTDGADDAGNNSATITITYADPVNPKKVKGCIHWISDVDAIPAKFELFTDLALDGVFNPNSKKQTDGFVQMFVMENLDKIFQFERLGYFKFDRWDNSIPVFIRITGLYDKAKPVN